MRRQEYLGNIYFWDMSRSGSGSSGMYLRLQHNFSCAADDLQDETSERISRAEANVQAT